MKGHKSEIQMRVQAGWLLKNSVSIERKMLIVSIADRYINNARTYYRAMENGHALIQVPMSEYMK